MANHSIGRYLVIAAWGATSAHAQHRAPATVPPAREDPDAVSEIVVRGDRRSAVTDLAPLATLGVDAVAATGATNMGELLRAIRAVIDSGDGSPPIFLINGQRVSGYEEISTLPPEAIEKVEVLPEQAALKFGYPPTRRVVNFIMKRQFRQFELKALAGTSTDGGAAMRTANASMTRLRDQTRLTMALEYSHTDALPQSRRDIVADPDVLFDGLGNVTGLDGAAIDPALNAAAGGVVTVAAVPASAADRSTLPAYVAGANRARSFDLSRYRDLAPGNDALKGNLVFAGPIGGTLSGSMSLSAETKRDSARQGPSSAILFVPAGNPFSPFARDVLLYRALIEADALRQHSVTTTLHGGGTVRGAVKGWQWDLTANVDQQSGNGRNRRAIDTTRANAAIAGGADPFVPLRPDLLTDLLVDHARARERTAGAKTVVTGSPLRLPAGKVTLTATAEAERATASGSTRGPSPYDIRIARTRTEGGLAIDLPITSRRDDVLPFAGDLSLNASGNARAVSGYGTLYDTTYGVNWTPLERVQFTVTQKDSAAAPALGQLSQPEATAPTVYFFDFATGRNVLTAAVSGGNPDLLPEHRHVLTLAINVKPFAKNNLRLSANLDTSDIRNQSGNVYALTAYTRAYLPEVFVSDAAGRLTTVNLRPFNFYRERKRTLNLVANYNGPLGKPPLPPKAGDTNSKPITRPSLYTGIGAYIILRDLFELKRGLPELNVLQGDTIYGGGKPQTVIYTYGGITYLGMGGTFEAQWVEGSHLHSDNPAGDLRFGAVPKLKFSAYATLHDFMPKAGWTKQLRVTLDVENAFNRREHVRARDGTVPNRFQGDYLDPVGRTVKLSLRKLF